MARICNHPGCGGAHVARGMCQTHYQQWTRANPGIRQQQANKLAVLAALPGTQEEIIMRTGLRSETVRRAITIMSNPDADGGQQMHIEKFKRPARIGERFRPIFKRGPGKNAVLTDSMRLSQKKRTVKKCGERRKERKDALNKAKSVTRQFGWAAALLMGA